MDQDSLKYDSLNNRPLPQWLINQREGLNTTQPQKIIMKEDKSLYISFALTSIFVVLLIAVLTIYILRNKKSQSQ